MKIFLYILFITFFFSNSFASSEKELHKKISEVKTLGFKFNQTLNGKDEKGECIINYPGKIYCKYESRFNKIVVSNGKSLVIRSDKNNQYFRYNLESTPLSILLNKELILNQIINLKLKDVNDKYYMLSLNEKGQEINIFFGKENLNLIGWQTEDIYQNLTVTYIYDVEINKKIDNKIFNLPKL